MGIEPTSSAWEAEVMPLYDTRMIKRSYLNTPDCSQDSCCEQSGECRPANETGLVSLFQLQGNISSSPT